MSLFRRGDRENELRGRDRRLLRPQMPVPCRHRQRPKKRPPLRRAPGAKYFEQIGCLCRFSIGQLSSIVQSAYPLHLRSFRLHNDSRKFIFDPARIRVFDGDGVVCDWSFMGDE